MVQTKYKYENQPRTIIQKELWFLSTALLLNEIYPYMKFQVDSSYSLRVTVRTKIKYENQQRAINKKV